MLPLSIASFMEKCLSQSSCVRKPFFMDTSIICLTTMEQPILSAFPALGCPACLLTMSTIASKLCRSTASSAREGGQSHTQRFLRLCLKMYFILLQNVVGGGAASSSLCFLYSSTICPGTAFSLKWRPMFLKPSVLSSHHDCCHSRLIPGSCFEDGAADGKYCIISFPSAIISRRRYSLPVRVLPLENVRLELFVCLFLLVHVVSAMLSEYKRIWGTGRMSSIQEVHSSFFISSSILRYRAKARLPSECPDMEAIRFGSLTCR